ncbi:MAG: AAA family ATPase [archaeon]
MIGIIKELSNPKVFPEKPLDVKIIQTHISVICLTGKYAYKFKKHVNFGFLDFSTLEKRKFYCEEELRLNRRLSPEIYLEMVELRENNGIFSINGKGKLVDYGIKMKEFSQEKIITKLVQKNLLTSEQIKQITDLLVNFYKKAKTNDKISKYGSVKLFKINTDENFEQTKSMIGKTISKGQFELIEKETNEFYKINSWLFEKRVKDGMIKECHGDLHTGNMFLDGNRIKIFDCIEFNERFKNSDVAADIAFLSMDMDFHGKEELSKELIINYVKKSGDWELLKVLNFYKCYRAYVRGKVTGFLLNDKNVPENEKKKITATAKNYFTLAERYAKEINYRYIEFKKPVVIMTSGFSATGKSFITKWFRKFFEIESLSTDIIRKELFNIPLEEKTRHGLGEGIYSPENVKKVYDELFLRCKNLVSEGKNCLLDAVFIKRALRERGMKTAMDANAEFLILNTVAEDKNIKFRLAKKAKSKDDPSDATWKVYLKQKENWEEFSDEEKKHALKIDGNTFYCYEEAYDKIIERLKENIK